MALYDGVRINGEQYVRREAHPLSPRWSLSIRNHSPAGFNWGYCGSGPAQLALAILLEETTVVEARRFYQHFKRSVVAAWESDRWAITSEGVANWLKEARETYVEALPPEEEDADEPE